MASVQLDAVGPQDFDLRHPAGEKLVGQPPEVRSDLFSLASPAWDEVQLFTVEDRFVSCSPGSKSSLILDGSGDYADLSSTMLRVTLPAATPSGPRLWRARVGLRLVERVKVWGGDQLLEDVAGRSLRMLQDAYSSTSHAAAGDALVGGRVSVSTAAPLSLLVPLRLLGRGGGRTLRPTPAGWFPIGAAYKTQIRVEITWAPWRDLVQLAGTEGPSEAGWFASNLLGLPMLLTQKAFFKPDSMGTRDTMQHDHRLLIETVMEISEPAYVEAGSATIERLPAPRVTVLLQSLNGMVKCLFFGAEDAGGSYLPSAILDATVAVGSRQLFDPLPFDVFSLYLASRRGVRSDPALPLGLHSFALHTDAPDLPCGALNFSVLTRPSLKLRMRTGHGAESIRVFALLHRFMRVTAGRVDMLLEP